MCSLTDCFFPSLQKNATPLRTVGMPNLNSWTWLPLCSHANSDNDLFSSVCDDLCFCDC